MIHVIRHRTPVGVLPLLFFDVLVLSACFYAAAEFLYPPSGWYYLFLEGGIALTGIAIAMIVSAMYFFDLYPEVRVGSRFVLAQQLCQALGAAILAQTVAAYLFRDWTVPQPMMLYASGFALAAMFCWRLVFNAFIERIAGRDRLLFLGRNETAEAVARAIDSNPKTGFRVLGFLDDDASGARVLGSVSSLRGMVEEYKPSLLVVGLTERRAVMPVGDLVALRFSGLQIEEASTTFESVYQRISLRDLSEEQVMFTRDFAPGPGALNVAAISSFLLAALSLLLLSPLLLLIALWLKVRGRTPVLLSQTRAGMNGRVFRMLRFPPEPALARFHLDALPELVNVLRGEMSLVGPRAETPANAVQLSESLPFYNYRMSVPPGMTGWAQIHQTPENQDDRELALEYDLYYIKHLSLILNLYILTHSLKNRAARA